MLTVKISRVSLYVEYTFRKYGHDESLKCNLDVNIKSVEVYRKSLDECVPLKNIKPDNMTKIYNLIHDQL